MKRTHLISLLLVIATFGTGCQLANPAANQSIQTLSQYQATREYELVGRDQNGDQIGMIIKVKFGGAFSDLTQLDQRVQAVMVEGSNQFTSEPGLKILRNQMQYIDFDSKLNKQAILAQLKTEFAEPIQQITRNNVGFTFTIERVMRVWNYQDICEKAAAKYLESNGVVGVEATCADDSDGDQRLTFQWVDTKASDRWGLTIRNQAKVKVPDGTVKQDKADQQFYLSQFPERKVIEGLQGGSSVPIVPVNPNSTKKN